jgi:hypothetical protein
LKNKLKDSRLQKIIKKIDTSKNREKTLDHFIKNDKEFSKFIHEVLYLIGEKDELLDIE